MGSRIGIAAIGALLALVFQVVVAPNIAIMGTMPSFVICYVLAVALLLPGTPSYVIAFCLGIMADLLGYGPVGALSVILLIAAFCIEQADKTFGNGTLFVSCITYVAFVLLVHFLHAGFMVAVTSGYSAADAMRLIAIPQALYDCVLGVLVFLLMRRVLTPVSHGIVGSGPSGIRLR